MEGSGLGFTPVQIYDEMLASLAPHEKIYERLTVSSSVMTSLTMLQISTDRALNSVMILLQAGKVWDAEILMRSAQEGFLKFCFILSELEDIDSRAHEFNDLSVDMAPLKTHEEIRELLGPSAQRGEFASGPLAYLLTEESDFVELQDKYPRPFRNKLETKWGFRSIARELKGHLFFSDEEIAAILYSYVMSSHQGHMDGIGLNMVFERESRTTLQRDQANFDHHVAIVNRAFGLRVSRLLYTFDFSGEDPAKLSTTLNHCVSLMAPSAAVVKRSHEAKYPPKDLAALFSPKQS